MKTATLITALLFSTVLLSQNLSRIPKSNPFNEQSMERKYIALSVGLDASNAIFGGKKINGVRRNERAIDLSVRPMFGFGSWEIGVPLEFFPAINYQSVGLDLNYVVPITNKIIALGGVEWDYVSRKGLKNIPQYKKDTFRHNVPAANLRLRWEAIGGTRFFIEGQANYKYRTDIGYFYGKDEIPKVKDGISGTVSVGAKF